MIQRRAGVKAGLCLATAHLGEERDSIVLLRSSSRNVSKTSLPEARNKYVISRRELLPEARC